MQLIIISHDSDLVRIMKPKLEHYFEVTKDKNQFSKIVKKDIKELLKVMSY